MNRRKATVLAAMAATLALAAPALADDRLVSHPYSDKEVVRIDGKAGVQATIQFGDGESIENVAVGDSQSWQITPNKRADLLFVKPLEGSARTNMTVVTNRHTYFFDLVASAKARPLYMLRFTYKDEPRSPAVPVPATASLNSDEQALASGDPVAMPADPASLNFAWRKTGMEKLLPARVYDDGSATYLVWPEKASVPAILIQNEKGEEGPVNYAVRDATIVISEVPPKIILRSGKASAVLEHAGPPPAARPSAAMAANLASSSPAAAVTAPATTATTTSAQGN